MLLLNLYELLVRLFAVSIPYMRKDGVSGELVEICKLDKPPIFGV